MRARQFRMSKRKARTVVQDETTLHTLLAHGDIRRELLRLLTAFDVFVLKCVDRISSDQMRRYLQSCGNLYLLVWCYFRPCAHKAFVRRCATCRPTDPLTDGRITLGGGRWNQGYEWRLHKIRIASCTLPPSLEEDGRLLGLRLDLAWFTSLQGERETDVELSRVYMAPDDHHRLYNRKERLRDRFNNIRSAVFPRLCWQADLATCIEDEKERASSRFQSYSCVEGCGRSIELTKCMKRRM